MSMENAPPPDLKVNIIQALETRHFTNAVQSYQNAIQCLNYYINSGEAQLRVTPVYSSFASRQFRGVSLPASVRLTAVSKFYETTS